MTEKEKIIDIAKVEFDIQFGCGDYIEIGDKEAFADSLADTLIENGIGDISEWKARAEVLERALRNSLFDLLSIGCMVIDLGGEKDLTEKYNLDLVGNMPYRIKQAEREIEEERK